MLAVLAHPIYRSLFAAQALSLVGTGLTTVALGLLAYDLAGERAGAVLGIVLMLKMIAYVGFSPIAQAFAGRFERRRLLVTLDLLRAAFVFGLPFVDALWQVYVLVFTFQLMSAAFTPTFQGTIPDVLPDEKRYTDALALSRMAYDLESLLSPLLAGLLLTVVGFHWLFVGTTAGFLASAALVLSVRLPQAEELDEAPFLQRASRGVRIYLATPRLRGLLALSFAVAAVGAMVIVDTVVHVREVLGLGEKAYAAVLAASGGGSMMAALLLPRLRTRLSVRSIMLSGGLVLSILPFAVLLRPDFTWTLVIWAALGAGMALVTTPAGILLRRSSHAADRPSLFAAQFALSHACWLVTYPLAGWLGVTIGVAHGFALMAIAAAIAVFFARSLWPADDAEELWHHHASLEHAHLHVPDEHHQHAHDGWEGPEPHRHPPRHGALDHAHAFVIEDHHCLWP